MSPAAWKRVYRESWARYYTDEHVETILRRAFASGLAMNKVSGLVTWLSGATPIERVHPLQLGIFRRKIRTQRRSGMPIESPMVFYPRRALEITKSTVQWLARAQRYRTLRKRIAADPASRTYVDEALAPPPLDAAEDHLVQAFANQIPKTHGAPKQHETGAVERIAG
jgi:hypothetical protein